MSDFPELETRPLSTVTAAELMSMNLEPPKQIVDGIITVGLNILAGNPKSGKSFAMLGLSLSVANGGRAFNSIPVDRAGVLYLALEDNHFRLKARLKALNQQAPENLAFATYSPRLSDGGLTGIGAYLDEHPDTGLVVIDTLARISDPKTSGNIYDEDAGVGASLQALAMEFQVAIVVIHHTRKAAAGDFLHSVSGSAGLTGAADTVLVLTRKRNEATATLEVTGRDIHESSRELYWNSAKGGWIIQNAQNYEPQGPRFRKDLA